MDGISRTAPQNGSRSPNAFATGIVDVNQSMGLLLSHVPVNAHESSEMLSVSQPERRASSSCWSVRFAASLTLARSMSSESLLSYLRDHESEYESPLHERGCGFAAA